VILRFSASMWSVNQSVNPAPDKMPSDVCRQVDPYADATQTISPSIEPWHCIGMPSTSASLHYSRSQ